MAVCRWRRDGSESANLGQVVGRGLSAKGRARKSHRYHECASRLPARTRSWRSSALGWTRIRASPGRRGRWNRTAGGASSIWPPWAWPEPVPWRGPQGQAAYLRAVCNELKRLEEWQGENALDAQILSPRIYSCRVSSFTSSAGGWCRPDGRSFTARKAVWCCGLSGGPCSGHGALIQPSSTSRWHPYPVGGPSEAIHSISAADTVG